jgi:hypothetical protein
MGGGEVSGWSTDSERRRLRARFEEVGDSPCDGAVARGVAEMAASDDRDNAEVLWTVMVVALCTRSSG